MIHYLLGYESKALLYLSDRVLTPGKLAISYSIVKQLLLNRCACSTRTLRVAPDSSGAASGEHSRIL